MSKNHIRGKPEARAQTVGMLLAGSTQAWVAEAMKIILSPVKGWWNKWLSQKSLVDEKRSGKAFNSEKSLKNGYFQISPQNGAEHQKIC
jgi:hypothetical protein